MSELNRCPQCGAELPAGALGGLCPKCLLAAGLESRDEPARSEGSGSQAPTTPHSGTFVPPDPAWLATYFPQLEILELLGHGGMGAVYKARQPKLDRLVALKIIRPESADDAAFAERFNREARMLARLSHPHIVGVYDFGSVDIALREMNPQAECEDYTRMRTLYFFVMEYVDGTNLRQLLQSGDLLPQQALAIVPQICEALQFAHDEGVVHRDIKPENILLDKRGRVKIADFGLAKLAAGATQEFTLTGTHQVMGTPRYMAPEQMEGSHAVDHRADIYPLGVVFYEMLTGEVPMGHFEPPSKKVEVDVRLDEVVLRALAREPQRRYQHASDVKTDVESIAHSVGRDAASSPASDEPGLRAHQTMARWPIAVRLTISLLLVSLAIFGACSPFVRPWGQIYSSQSERWYDAYGFGWWQGMLVCYSLAGIALVVLATLPMRRAPFWRAPLITLLAIFALVGASSFIVQLTNGTLPVQPFLNAASWSIEIDGKPPYTTNDASQFLFAVVRDGPYVTIGVASCILLLVALELAFVWRQHASPFGDGNTGCELAREPQRRYQHASDVKDEVESISKTLSPIQPPAQDRDRATDDAELSAARQQVQLPVVGLLVLALFNLPLAGRAFLSRYGSSTLSENPEQFLVWLLFFVPPLATLVGAVKMLRLSSYRWSIAASLLVMLSPSVLEQRQVWWIWWLCVLIGVWSLVVLSKPEVKQAFRRRRLVPMRDKEQGTRPENGSTSLHVGDGAQHGSIWLQRLVIAVGIVSMLWLAFWHVPWKQEYSGGRTSTIFRPLHNPPNMGMTNNAFGEQPRAQAIDSGMLAFQLVVALAVTIGLAYALRFRRMPAEKHIATISRNPRSAAVHDEASPPGTLRRAWDDWWAQRDRWVTSSVQMVLCLVFIVCFIMYLSFQSSSNRFMADGQWLRHTTVSIGVPDPWFHWETYPDAQTPFRWKIDWVSTSTGIILLGFVAWCVNWQIEKAKAKLSGKKLRWWHGSPNFGVAFWLVATLIAMAMGITVAELPQQPARHKAIKEPLPSQDASGQSGDAPMMTTYVLPERLEIIHGSPRDGKSAAIPFRLALR